MTMLHADRLEMLCRGVERIQEATCDTAELQALVTQTLQLAAMADGPGTHDQADSAHASAGLAAALALLPQNADFSLGRRDEVCWAWIQPNDDWQPADFQARHDHPEGSGLVVAHSPALTLICAALRLRIRWLEMPVPSCPPAELPSGK